jgi:hypothetical protein
MNAGSDGVEGFLSVQKIRDQHVEPGQSIYELKNSDQRKILRPSNSLQQ